MRIKTIETSLFGFIWKYSKRDQIVLVFCTLLLFPLLYMTLELPKRIVNDAIQATESSFLFWGTEITQTTFLLILSFGFLCAVLAHGLLKMRVNTMKGVLAERMLHRFRYALIARILRFPTRYLRKTSEGELTSMITAEAEPLGGIMGDALAQPILQAGQMLTILAFLFVQSVWFGLAAIALIPLQAWLIPYLQRQINRLNKSRIMQVRALASDIGEISWGTSALRQHGGWRYRLALVNERLAGLFHTRFRIYQKKFFMKFLNNFITQLTPFFFFSIGGFLVIRGDLTIGALVAALGAFKDIAAPWKELLAYYTQVQEMSQRYRIIIERFTPQGLLADEFATKSPQEPTRLSGPLMLDGVTLRGDAGAVFLDDVTTTIGEGRRVCLIAGEAERAAGARLLTREVLPSKGKVMFGDQALSELSQQVIATDIGCASSAPAVFRGRLGDNLLLPLLEWPREQPFAGTVKPSAKTTPPIDLETQTVRDPESIAFCMDLIKKIGGQRMLVLRALDTPVPPDTPEDVTLHLTELRQRVRYHLVSHGTDVTGQFFDDQVYHDALSLPENLLFGVYADENDHMQDQLIRLLNEVGLKEKVLDLAVHLAAVLVEAFDADSTDHPLFRALGLPQTDFERLRDALRRHRSGQAPSLTAEEERIFLMVPFRIPAASFQGDFPDAIKRSVVAHRKSARVVAEDKFDAAIIPLDTKRFNPALTLLENVMFGRLPGFSSLRASTLHGHVADALLKYCNPDTLSHIIRVLPVDAKGAGLDAPVAELISLVQAAVKKPRLLVFDNALASWAPQDRDAAFQAIHQTLHNTTIIQLEPEEPEAGTFEDVFYMRKGKIRAMDMDDASDTPEAASNLLQKVNAIAPTPLFRGMSRKQLRLLAFSARWIYLTPGETLFHKSDPADGAYLIVEGSADLLDRDGSGALQPVAQADPGTLVGELGLIRDEPRSLTFRSREAMTLLHLSTDSFMSVVENDAPTALRLMRTIAGYIKPQS